MVEALLKAEHYFGEDGLLSKVYDGYEVRKEQLEFSKEIHEAIYENETFLGEANTGVGKSLAALTGASTIIEKTDKPVVIVTSSILLQSQYIEKDIPILSLATGRKYNEAIAKGKSNYVCLDKASNPSNFITGDNKEEVDKMMKWISETETGDYSEIDFKMSPKTFKEFTILEKNECKGNACPFYDKCFYYKNKEKLKSSKIIVCNYHYFFLSLSIPTLLPQEIGAVIFDEFHEVVGIARDSLEIKLNIRDFDRMNKSLARTQEKIVNSGNEEGVDLEFGSVVGVSEFINHKTEFHYRTTEWFIKKMGYGNKKEHLIIDEKEYSEVIGEYLNSLLQSLEILVDNIQYWLETKGVDEEILYSEDCYYSDDHKEWYISIVEYRNFASEYLSNVETLLNSVKKEGNLVGADKHRLVWIKIEENNSYADIVSKPFAVDELLSPLMTSDNSKRHRNLKDSVSIAMSATLTSSGRFDHFKEQLGLKERVRTSIVNSPFDMTENMLWYLPKDAPEGNQKGHNVFVLQELEELIKGLEGGVLALFTSNRSLKEASRHLKATFGNDEKINIIEQGEYSKSRLIEIMKENPNTVIVATRSFFTGVDIPGRNLRAVILDKLPFPMIGDPINEYLMTKRERGFFRYSLPETIITLKQAYGRLIRSKEDKGIVAVIDGRLRTKGYKNKIFNSFNFRMKGTTSRRNAIDFAKLKDEE